MEDKKYYWLRLKKDFFKRHDIQLIEAMPNGDSYIIFYLKLMCESIDHEGKLRFSDEIPYTIDMLATILGVNKKIAKLASEEFIMYGLLEVLEDGTYYIPQLENLIGFESEWAKKKRKYRTKEGQSEDNVLEMSSECPRDVLIGKRTNEGQKEDNVRQEKEKEKNKENIYTRARNKFNDYEQRDVDYEELSKKLFAN